MIVKRKPLMKYFAVSFSVLVSEQILRVDELKPKPAIMEKIAK